MLLTRGAGWLSAALLVTVAVAQASILVARKLGFATVGAQEAVMALAVPAVLLAVPAALAADRHVAVDAFASRASRVVGLWLALLLAGLLLWFAVPYAYASFLAGEGSYEVAGFGLRWAAKAVLPIFALLMGLQAAASLAHRG